MLFVPNRSWRSEPFVRFRVRSAGVPTRSQTWVRFKSPWMFLFGLQQRPVPTFPAYRVFCSMTFGPIQTEFALGDVRGREPVQCLQDSGFLVQPGLLGPLLSRPFKAESVLGAEKIANKAVRL